MGLVCQVATGKYYLSHSTTKKGGCVKADPLPLAFRRTPARGRARGCPECPQKGRNDLWARPSVTYAPNHRPDNQRPQTRSRPLPSPTVSPADGYVDAPESFPEGQKWGLGASRGNLCPKPPPERPEATNRNPASPILWSAMETEKVGSAQG